MSIPNKKHVPKDGFWRTENNQVFWYETDQYGNLIKKYDPQDIINISRSAEFKIIFIREIPDMNHFNQKIKKIFAQDVSMHLGENVDDSIVLKFEPTQRKFYISDLKELGQTFACPLESTPELIVSKSEPYLIDAKLAKNFLSQWNYGYGRVEVSASGEISYFVTV
jgi:hypothetical protein